MRRAAGVFLVLVAAATAGAEPLSRGETVARALSANGEVLRALEERRVLEARRDEALADALPQLRVLVAASQYRDPSFLNSSSFDAFPPDLRTSLVPEATPLYDGSIELRQTIWSFRLGSALRAARLAREMGEAQVRFTRQAVALEAVRAYDAYLLGLERVAVGEKALKLQQAHVQMAKLRYEAGVATELDVLRTQVDLENLRADLLRLQGQTDWDRGTLNAVMMRPIDTPIEPTDSLEIVPVSATLEEVTRHALESRPDIEVADVNGRVHDQLVEVARAEGRPRFDLAAAYGWSVREPEHFGDGDYTRWNAGVTVAIPVFDGRRTRSRVAMAEAERAKTVHARADVENRIRLEAEQAVDRLRTAQQVYDAAELNVGQARRALEMTEGSYRLGAVTVLDVADAQAALTHAEILRVQAMYEHANARALLRFAMGSSPLAEPSPSKESLP